MKQTKLFLLVMVALLAALLVPSIAMAEENTKPAIQITHYDEGEWSSKEVTAVEMMEDEYDSYFSINYSNVKKQEVNWTSSDGSVFTVNKYGNVKAVKAGKATLTATLIEDETVKDTVEITVKAKPVTEPEVINKLFISTPPVSIEVGGDSFDLFEYVKPYIEKEGNLSQSWDEEALIYADSDPEIVEIDSNGWIYGRKAGKATITGTVQDNPGLSVKTEIEVVEPEPDTTGIKTIKIAKEKFALEAGKTLRLYRNDILTFTDTKDKILKYNQVDGLEWESSDEDIATVNTNGTVTGKKPGTATISAYYTNADGSVVTTTTSVEVSAVGMKTIAFNKEKFSLKAGKSVNLMRKSNITFTDTDGKTVNNDSVTNLEWESSDEDVATVNDNGLVRATDLGGTATITVRYTNPDETVVTASTTIEVAGIGIKTITFSKDKFTLKAGKDLDLMDKSRTIFTNTNGKKSAVGRYEVEWDSSDEEIATVEDGVVTAGNKAGTVTITARYTNADDSIVKGTATVEITATKPTKITFRKAEYKAKLNRDSDGIKLYFDVEPDGAKFETDDLEIESSDPAIVKSGNASSKYIWVYPKKPGTVTITLKYAEDEKVTATTKVVTTATPVTKVTLPEKTWTLGYTLTTDYIEHNNYKCISPIIEPENAFVKNIHWVSSDTTVAMVNDSGEIWATGLGRTTITVYVDDGSENATTKPDHQATMEVIVASKVINLALSETSATIKMQKDADNTLELFAINADTEEDVPVRWKSSDKAVATVKDGVVTAKKAGTVTITATTKDGNKTKATCTVTVKKAKVTSLKASKSKLSMKVGDTKKLSITIKPSYAYNKALTFTSSKPKIVSVDENGKLTALKAGKSTITVKAADGSKKTCKIKVTVK